MSQKKHIAQLRSMVPSDWEIKIGSHIKLVSPEGFVVTCGNTISDWRAVENIKRDIRHTLAKIEEWKARKVDQGAKSAPAPEPKKKHRRRGR